MNRLPDRPRHVADNQADGAGCLSGFVIPPLVVLLVGAVLATIAFRSPAAETALPPRAPGTSLISGIFTPEVQYWSTSILRWAAASELDPNLIAVIIQIESCGDPFARSRAGAIGLFQVMPYHFLDTDDAYSPDANATRGLDYLKRALAAANGDVRLALAGYNGGISIISRAEWSWPDETIRYAYWGSGIYADAANGTSQSTRLAEWLAAGGRGLCAAAGEHLQIGT